MSGAEDDADGLEWTAEGAPRSRRYGDVYFSREGGLAETRAVFLDGCGLPDVWTGRERFTVGELGFGTGLNVLALLQLWAAARPPGARLHVMSVEAHPLTVGDAARALALWPELAGLARPLLARWPRAPGVTRIDWRELGATLDVIVGEAGAAVEGWDGAADAWFLDGFSPARNPEMWREAVLAGVTVKSAPGARLATFTVAGAVRRGLEAQGWTVERRPGHGAKRQRLEARLASGGTLKAALNGPVVVIGAGVAGAAVARALRTEARAVTVIAGPLANASENAAGLVSPRLERGRGPAARLSAQAFRRAAAVYADEAADAVLTRGVRRLARAPDALADLAGSGLFEAGELVDEDADARAAALGEAVADGLLMTDALVVDPRRVTAAWLAGAKRVHGVAARLERVDGGWCVLDADGGVLAKAAAVVLAGGWGAATLRPDLGLRAVRGQVSVAPRLVGPAASWGGYCAPSAEGLAFGATHDRGDEGEDLRAEDHVRNLATLRGMLPALAGRVDPAALQGRAGVRAATADHLPVAGPMELGLWVLGGLGGRGFTTAPLLGEHVAAAIVGAPSPLPLDLSEAVRPDRFARRAEARRGGSRGRAEALSSAPTGSGEGP